jgi:hypothetical protein
MCCAYSVETIPQGDELELGAGDMKTARQLLGGSNCKEAPNAARRGSARGARLRGHAEIGRPDKAVESCFGRKGRGIDNRG